MGIFKLFRNQDRIGPDYDALVATECPECFIRIGAWKEEDPRLNVVFIGMLSSHNNNDVATWKWRRTRIWRIIRGINDPDYEVTSPEIMGNLIKALQECKETVWGSLDPK
jgi:hypothetical protein